MNIRCATDEDEVGRTIELPFRFGDVVYHRVRSERIAGIVVGFVVFATEVCVKIRWEDDLTVTDHPVWELSLTYEPIDPGS